MLLYTTKEISKILTNSNNDIEVTELMEYIFENAVAIISIYGATYYNFLVFSIKEKYRLIQPVSL